MFVVFSDVILHRPASVADFSKESSAFIFKALGDPKQFFLSYVELGWKTILHAEWVFGMRRSHSSTCRQCYLPAEADRK